MEQRPVSQVTWVRLLDLSQTVPASPGRRELLLELAHGFRRPVLGYLRSACGLSEEEASRATTAFFDAVGERVSSQELAADRGAFRRYLRRMLAEMHGSPPEANVEADARFDAEWLRCVLRESLEQMHTTLVRDGRAQAFDAFWAHEVEAAGSAERTIKATAERLGTSETEADALLAGARGEWRAATRVVALGTVTSVDALDAEMEALFGQDDTPEEMTRRLDEASS